MHKNIFELDGNDLPPVGSFVTYTCQGEDGFGRVNKHANVLGTNVILIGEGRNKIPVAKGFYKVVQTPYDVFGEFMGNIEWKYIESGRWIDEKSKELAKIGEECKRVILDYDTARLPGDPKPKEESVYWSWIDEDGKKRCDDRPPKSNEMPEYEIDEIINKAIKDYKNWKLVTGDVPILSRGEIIKLIEISANSTEKKDSLGGEE